MCDVLYPQGFKAFWNSEINYIVYSIIFWWCHVCMATLLGVYPSTFQIQISLIINTDICSFVNTDISN